MYPSFQTENLPDRLSRQRTPRRSRLTDQPGSLRNSLAAERGGWRARCHRTAGPTDRRFSGRGQMDAVALATGALRSVQVLATALSTSRVTVFRPEAVCVQGAVHVDGRDGLIRPPSRPAPATETTWRRLGPRSRHRLPAAVQHDRSHARHPPKQPPFFFPIPVESTGRRRSLPDPSVALEPPRGSRSP